MLRRIPFVAPQWAACKLSNVPKERIKLGHFPTPIFPFPVPGVPTDVEIFIKRDDYSGIEISGNKARKLEFLLLEAIKAGSDCIVTCGGIQSNHCRATAVAARMLGLDSYLLLRTTDPDEDPGLVGNLLLDRLVDANIILLSREEYAKYGSEAMIQKTCDKLRLENRKPFAIPVGGSNGIGTWGYVDAVAEIHQQLEDLQLGITDVAFACGSGGSSAGMGLGFYLYSSHVSNQASGTKLSFASDQAVPVHAFSVCDSPAYFYKFMDERILPEMGLKTESGISSRQFLSITDVKGRGYARSTSEELEFIRDVARTTGVLLDPVYSGKALFGLVKSINETPEKFAGKRILFVHTGGLFGLYDKTQSLSSLIDPEKLSRFQM